MWPIFRATEARWWGGRRVTMSIRLKVRRSEGGPWSRQGWFLHCRIVSSGKNLYSSLRCINGYRRHIIGSTLGKHFMHGGGGVPILLGCFKVSTNLTG